MQQVSMRSCFTAAAALAAIAIASPAVAQNGEMPEMVQVTQSPHSFAVTVDRFRTATEEAGWSLLNETNMAGVLSARGYTLDPVIIFDACSGQYSAQILGMDEARPISAFMPCRVSIYQDSQGDVFISRMNVSAFLPMMPDEVAEVMELSSNEVEAIIEQTVAE